MKKLCFATLMVAILASSAVMTAAEKDSTRMTVNDPYPSFKGFVTNKFWDNWEISLGFGTGFSVYSGRNYGSWGDRFGLNGELSVTKWLHPVVGIRAGLMGGTYSSVHPDYGKACWPFLYGHVDAMANLSNWIGGYKENRVYYAVLYAGMGLFGSNFTDASQAVTKVGTPVNFAFNAGLLNKFRVSPSVDINLELRGILGMASLNPVQSPSRGRFLGTGNVSVGVTYRFGKRDFERGAAGYTLDDIKYMKMEAEQAALKAQETEENLENELAETQKREEAAMQRAKEAEAQLAAAQAKLDQMEYEASLPTEMIFFDYAMAVLTPADKISLGVFASEVKEGPADHVYTITGYADFKTGSKAKNTALAEKRARVVYEYLVSLGIPADRLTYKGAGENDQPFSAEGNQAVIIK